MDQDRDGLRFWSLIYQLSTNVYISCKDLGVEVTGNRECVFPDPRIISLTHSPTLSLVRTHTLTHSFTHSLTHSSSLTLNRSRIHTPIRLLTCSLTHPLTHSLTLSLTQFLSHSPFLEYTHSITYSHTLSTN